jgi:hypothetical protein
MIQAPIGSILLSVPDHGGREGTYPPSDLSTSSRCQDTERIPTLSALLVSGKPDIRKQIISVVFP